MALDNKVRYVWGDEETLFFLELIKEANVNAILNGKQQRNATVYQELQKQMMAKGFDKTWQILRSKWKSFKQRYMAERRRMASDGWMDPSSYFRQYS